MDVSLIMEYEAGTLSNEDTLVLFSDLIATGTVWRLQGSYGRAATHLIHLGLIGEDGTVDWDRYAELTEEV